MSGWRRYWPAAVPVVWAAAVFALMRPDAPKAADVLPEPVKWLLYDESDLTALALRGLNADGGRLPGRPDEPPELHPDELAAALNRPQPPPADRFYLEYPTPALAVFALPFAWNPPADDTPVPTAVADARQYQVAHFVPRTDAERRLWGRLRFATRVYVAVGAAALAGLVLVLGRGPGPVWLCALPAAAYFAVNRFDALPALATAVGFAALARGRAGWAGAWLAVGTLLKLYPVLFVPVVLRFLGWNRNGWAFAAGFAGVLLAGFGGAVLVCGWDGTAGPIRVQLARPLELGWTLYGRVLPEALGRHGGLRLALLAATVLAVSARRPTGHLDVLRRCALVLLAFVALAVFWSPQWVLWFLPLLVPLAAGSRRVLALAVAFDVVTYLTFPVANRSLQDWPDTQVAVADALVAVRIGLWAALAVVLARLRPA